MFSRFLVLLAALAAGAALAQQSPSEVTDGEIAKYKATAQKGCRDTGMKYGDPQEKVNAFCNCVLSTLEQSMKRAEWQQAYFYSLKGQEADEKLVLAPHVKQLSACRPDTQPKQ
jgi:hypothetical protein